MTNKVIFSLIIFFSALVFALPKAPRLTSASDCLHDLILAQYPPLKDVELSFREGPVVDEAEQTVSYLFEQVRDGKTYPFRAILSEESFRTGWARLQVLNKDSWHLKIRACEPVLIAR